MRNRRSPTPDEESVLRMIRDAGSPAAAGQGLLARLEALEAAVARLEDEARREAEREADGASEPNSPSEP